MPNSGAKKSGALVVPAIRRAVATDAIALASFAEASFRHTFAPLNDTVELERYVRSTFSPSLQAAEIAADGSTFFLAVETGSAGETLAGYAHLIHAPPSMELRRLYVDQDWKGHGLASRLVDAAVAECRMHGADRLWLGVWEHNPRAIGFYRKAGFEICGQTTFLFGTEEQTDLLMELQVGPLQTE